MNKIKNFLSGNYYLLMSLLMFLSFPSFDVWFLKGYTFFAWISLVPLFMFIKGRSYRGIFLSTFLAGLIGHFLTYQWIGNFGAEVTGGYTVVLLFLIPSLTVVFTAKFMVAEFLSRRFPALRYLIYPGAWLLLDWIQSLGFLAFPWPYWGYSQYLFTPFIQISSITGIMGITFIVVMFNYLLSDLLLKIKDDKIPLKKIFKLTEGKRFIVISGVVLISIIYGLIVLSINSREIKSDLKVSIVQTCISPWEKWRRNRFRYLRSLKKITDEAVKENPDLIVWSESATLESISYHYDLNNLNQFESELLDSVVQWETPLLTGEIGRIILDNNTMRRYPQNNAVLISNEGEVVKSYPKVHLVPFGEWFPYEKWFRPIKNLVDDFGGSSFVPGVGPEIFELNNHRFGVLICYEGIFHRFCREYKKLGVDYLVNITNDGWTDTFNGHMQHFSASPFRAIENGIWLVRAGNTGFTSIIDPYGRIVKSIPILKKGYLVGDMDFSFNHETVFSKFGDIFLYIVMIFLGVLFIITVYNVINEKRKSQLQ